MATASVTNTLTNGTTVDAPDLNTNFTDLVTFLNASVLQKDGSIAATAALPMGSNKITGLADGTAATDAAAFGQVPEDDFLVTFTQAGELATGTGTTRFYLPFNATIVDVEASVGTAPTGASLIIDVNVDGTTVFTGGTNRPTIAAAGFHDEAGTVDDDAHTDGQYLTVDIDQVGSTIAGSDLVVVVHLRRT